MKKYNSLFGDNEYWFEIGFSQCCDFLSSAKEWGCKWANGKEISVFDSLAYTHYAITSNGELRYLTEMEWVSTPSDRKVRKRSFNYVKDVLYQYDTDDADAYSSIEAWEGDGYEEDKLDRMEEKYQDECRAFKKMRADIGNGDEKLTKLFTCSDIYERWFYVSIKNGVRFLEDVKKRKFIWLNGDEIIPSKGIKGDKIAILTGVGKIYYLTDKKWEDERFKIVEKVDINNYFNKKKIVYTGNYEEPILPSGMYAKLRPEYVKYEKEVAKVNRLLKKEW